MTRHIRVITILFLLFLFMGCTPSKKEGKTAEPMEDKEGVLGGLTPEEAAKVVAKVGDTEITVGDVTRQINRLSPYIRAAWNAPEKRRQFAEKMVRVEILAKEAERLGLDKDPEVQRAVDQAMIRQFRIDDLEKNVLPKEVTPEETKAFFDQNQKEFNKPEQLRVSMILLKTKAEADKLLAELKAKPDDPKFFREMAEKRSIDAESKARGGDLRYIAKEPGTEEEGGVVVDEAVRKAAWTLKNPGELYPEAIRTANGFAIIKMTNKKEAVQRDLEQVRRIIENRLLRQKRTEAMDKYVEGLKSKASVKVYEDNLKLVKITMPEHSHEGPELPPGLKPGIVPPAPPKVQ